MKDQRLLAALQDAESFRRYRNDCVVEAMREEIQRVNDEEDDRVLYGTRDVPVGQD